MTDDTSTAYEARLTKLVAGYYRSPHGEDIPAAWTDHLPRKDFIDSIDYDNEIERIRILLDRSHSYMRNAHLLPPPDEFGSADEYVHVLERFERAPATQVSFYRFNPTTEQLRANAAVLSRWHAAQHRPRSGSDRQKRAAGLLDWRCFTANTMKTTALARIRIGEREEQTRNALRYLAPLVNEGHLTRDQLADAIIDASWRNGHLPDNRTLGVLEDDIDRAISKYAEPFDWDRLDDDAH